MPERYAAHWPTNDPTVTPVDIFKRSTNVQAASALLITGFLGAYTTFSAFCLIDRAVAGIESCDRSDHQRRRLRSAWTCCRLVRNPHRMPHGCATSDVIRSGFHHGIELLDAGLDERVIFGSGIDIDDLDLRRAMRTQGGEESFVTVGVMQGPTFD